MKRIICLVALCLCVSAWPLIAQRSFTGRIGVVNDLDDDHVCFAVQNSKLKPGSSVQVVITEKPQTIWAGNVVVKLDKSCSSDIDFAKNLSFYRLQKRGQDYVTLGIGVIGFRKISRTKGMANSDLNGDGRKEYFRECSSNEGVHLTVWTGKPLIGRRIWHAYYYLPYDTDPTCKNKDYK